MKWFKFYGQDWLTDLKVMQMSMEDRLCFITLLCLASSSNENGVIRNCDEESIIRLSNIPNDVTSDFNPYESARGCLQRYKALQSVTINDNGDVTVCNFTRRQGENLSNAERQKTYRERLKIKTKPRNERNVTQRNDSNARIDKNRIEENIQKDRHGELEKVKLTKEEYSKLLERFGEKNTSILIFELDTYIGSKGDQYKSHYATLLNWAKRKFDNINNKQTSKGRGLAE